ncbi:hypothetical protein GLX_20850 [Komagataeibacter medellinensis NBRC 3288]|uniref:Uncharacterized protein n=2 Tax=Komagataeibacter medellinensis TaxID=1177712 RepID=G2I0N9_KOMMN|nr:hypothetical protein GLX_20850 [Komagataeibacter medellinensis NBRC 3288]
MTVRFIFEQRQSRAGRFLITCLRGFSFVPLFLGMGLPSVVAAHGVDRHAAPPAIIARDGRDKPAAEPSLDSLETELAHAATARGARDLQGRIEQQRLKELAPTTTLLVRRAQDDLDAQRPLDAVQDMDDALLLQPEVEVLWRNRAQARLVARNLDGAVADLGVALHHDGRDVMAWKILEDTEEQRGDWQAAWKAWQHVLQLDPTTPDADHETQKLRLKAFGQPT